MIGMIAVFVGMAIGLSVISTQSAATYRADRNRKQAQAFALAEAGAELGYRWLCEQGSPPSGTSTIPVTSGTVTLGTGTITVSIVPASDNAQKQLKTYTVRSTGTVDGVTQAVDVKMRNQSFGRFAYFSDQESPDPMNSQIWFGVRDRIRGPMFTNNANGSKLNIDNLSLKNPIFQSSVEIVDDEINYRGDDPQTDDQYKAVYDLGRSAVKMDVTPVNLPSNTSTQAAAAWGASSGMPTAQGVYVPSSGGVYVVGDCDLTMSAPSDNVQVLTFRQGSVTTTVEINMLARTTTTTVGSTVTTRSTAGNGVVFVTGNINSIRGTVADSVLGSGSTATRQGLTIVADAAASRQMVITGSIQYRTKNNPALGPSEGVNARAGILGLFANRVRIGSSAGSNVTVDGLILAGTSAVTGGGFGADDYDDRSTGTLTLNGGLIQRTRYPVGTFSGSRQVSGFIKDYYYDARMMDTPPPFFPTTGRYDKIGWTKQ